MEDDNRHKLSARALINKSRIAELSIGLTTSRITVYFFDYVLYPFIVYQFGIVRGGVVMTLLSLIACLIAIKIYDWSKRDWLGIEAVKTSKTYDGNKRIGRITAWIMQKSDPIAFLFLSIKFDPFITTAYLRHGKFAGMSKRDWKIFIGSLLVSNAYWTLACYMGITLLEWGLRGIVG